MSIQQPGQGTAAAEATDGAGHFVKMVHNGIEYADMQFIGEAYELPQGSWSGQHLDAWRRVVCRAVTAGVPVPGFAAALAY
jgi:6-phosphogluconate dehydrogenase